MSLKDGIKGAWELNSNETKCSSIVGDATLTENIRKVKNGKVWEESSDVISVVDGAINVDENCALLTDKNVLNYNIFSIQVWFKPTQLNQRTKLFCSNDCSYVNQLRQYEISLIPEEHNDPTGNDSNNGIRFFIYTDKGLQNASILGGIEKLWDVNSWVHCICTYNNETKSAKVYVNGVKENEIITEGDLLNSDNFYKTICHSWSSIYQNEVIFWNRELSSVEISDLYNDGIGVSLQNIING